MADDFKIVKDEANPLADVSGALVETNKATAENFDEGAVSARRLGTALGGVAKDSLEAKNALVGVFGALAGGKPGDFLGSIAKLGSTFVGAMNGALGFSGAISTMSSEINNFVGATKELSGETVEKIFGEGARAAFEAEKDLLKTQDTSRVAFARMGANIEIADSAALHYGDTLRQMSAAYSISGKHLDDMMKSLQGVPIVMNQNQEMFEDVIGTQQNMVSQLGVLATVSKTFGMTEEEAATRAKTGYLGFNQTVEDTVSALATMAAASKQTGVDRKIADDQIVKASQSLAIFGQHSDAAANVWTTFTSALKDTVPINEVGRMVTDLTAKIAGMSVQNRAFIGMMSGFTQGQSAMGGALQLELAMRSPEGMEKNIEAMTSSLSQFAGGKIITLEEAASNPQMEIQFQLQREMLGKISGITSAQDQNRVLEVLQQVQSGGMSQVEGSKEISSLMEEGTSIQERQLATLEQIRNNISAVATREFKRDQQAFQVGEAFKGRGPRETTENLTGTRGVGEVLKTIPVGSSLLGDPNWQKSIAGSAEGLMGRLGDIDTVDMGKIYENAKALVGEVGQRYMGTEASLPREPREPSGERKRRSSVDDVGATVSKKASVSVGATQHSAIGEETALRVAGMQIVTAKESGRLLYEGAREASEVLSGAVPNINKLVESNAPPTAAQSVIIPTISLDAFPISDKVNKFNADVPVRERESIEPKPVGVLSPNTFVGGDIGPGTTGTQNVSVAVNVSVSNSGTTSVASSFDSPDFKSALQDFVENYIEENERNRDSVQRSGQTSA